MIARSHVFLLIVSLASALKAEAPFPPERRRDQFPNEPGYAVVPFAYSLPGIGLGYGVLGAATNIRHTCTDVSAAAFSGDANGQAIGVDAIHLIPRRLILDLGGVHLSRSTMQSYAKRGMETDKKDYSLADFGDFLFGGARLTGSFWERRAEIFAAYYAGRTRLHSLRDHEGNMILQVQGGEAIHFQSEIVGGRLDFTDDYIDPRRGLRFEPTLGRSPPSTLGPDYLTADNSLTGYLPLGLRSTWAFNYLRSDAVVLRKGETDPSAIEREQGLDCSVISDPKQHADCVDYAANAAAQNALGAASALGGVRRLRSFPEGRYRGAHSEFFGTEIRWNLTDEVTPFNIYLMKDIRTAVQVSFFYEIGSVADSRGELWKIVRQSYGSGLRIVTASGLIYRFDLAYGEEGLQPSVFFQYPWEL